MTKIAAMGGFEGAAGEGCPNEAVAKLEAVLEGKGSGDILTAEEAAAVKEALAVIGSDTAEWSEDDAWVGTGAAEFEAEGAGIKVAAASKLGVAQVMDRNRMLWELGLGLKKLEGADALKLFWEYRLVSFGTNDVTGEPCIILDRVYTREVKDSATIAAFNAGEEVKGTRMDFTAFKQWGFFAKANAKVYTTEGILAL